MGLNYFPLVVLSKRSVNNLPGNHLYYLDQFLNRELLCGKLPQDDFNFSQKFHWTPQMMKLSNTDDREKSSIPIRNFSFVDDVFCGLSLKNPLIIPAVGQY